MMKILTISHYPKMGDSLAKGWPCPITARAPVSCPVAVAAFGGCIQAG
jgi:hypothetical protein